MAPNAPPPKAHVHGCVDVLEPAMEPGPFKRSNPINKSQEQNLQVATISYRNAHGKEGKDAMKEVFTVAVQFMAYFHKLLMDDHIKDLEASWNLI